MKLSALKSGQGWALLDGGATHCMRNARRAESEAALPCLVHLASGEAELRINKFGKLLTLEPAQPLVALGKLIELGYNVLWSKGNCRIQNRRGKTWKVTLRYQNRLDVS